MAMRAVALGLGLAMMLAAPAAAQDRVPDEADDPSSTAVALRAVETRMTVEVAVNGAGPFRFIVDSGANRTVISARLAALLRLPPAGEVRLHSVGDTGVVPTVRIAALGLGTLPARAIVAPVLDEGNLGAAGILGIDALANRKVVIDLIRNRMTVEPGDRVARAAATDEIVVTATRRNGQLVMVDADAAGQRIWAVMDTGGMVTIGNGVLRAKLVRRGRVAPIDTTITDVVGNIVPASFVAIGAIRIGGFRLVNPTIAFADSQAFSQFGLDAKPSMLVGMDMMRAFRRVSIDFRRRTVRLTRRGDA